MSWHVDINTNNLILQLNSILVSAQVMSVNTFRTSLTRFQIDFMLSRSKK